MKIESYISKIIKETGLSRKEIQDMVEKKKIELKGLISEIIYYRGFFYLGQNGCQNTYMLLTSLPLPPSQVFKSSTRQ